jgi:Tol biopolymer transport system component
LRRWHFALSFWSQPYTAKAMSSLMRHPLLLVAVAACTSGESTTAGTTRVWSGSPDFVSGDVSRDGRFLSQVNWNSGDLQLVDLQSGETRDLTGQGYNGGYAWTSAFSPDGKIVAAAWYLDSVHAHELRLFDVASGTWRVLVPAEASRYYVDPVDWSDSGDEILAAIQAPDRAWQLALIDVRDGSTRIVKSLGWQTPGGGHDQAYPDADLSPDGRLVAYDYPASETDPARDIFVVPSEGGAASVLVTGPGSDRLLGWFPAGDGILFYSDRNGTPSIWRLRVREGRAEGEPDLVQSAVHALVPLAFTSNGYAFGTTTASQQVHIGSTTDGTAKPARAVHDQVWRKSYVADWSPDGTRFAYITHDPFPDPVEILRIETDRGDTALSIPLTPALHSSNGSFRWATNDRVFVFAYERGLDGIHIIDLADTSWRRLNTPASLGRAAIKWFDVGPDGRTVYLIGSPRGPGRPNDIVAFDTETEAARVVHSARVIRGSVAVSPDGERLAILARDDSGRIELQVGPAKATGVFRSVYRSVRGRLGPPVAWTPDGSRLLVEVQEGDTVSDLWSIALAGGEPLKVLANCCNEQHVRMDRRGTRFAYAAGRDRGELHVLAMDRVLFDGATTR